MWKISGVQAVHNLCYSGRPVTWAWGPCILLKCYQEVLPILKEITLGEYSTTM